jgi:hypothetical protein
MGTKRKSPERGTDAYYEAKGLVKLTVRLPEHAAQQLRVWAEAWGASGVAEVISTLVEREKKR